MKLYTRTGDGGSTGLFGGQRVGKDDPRVEAYGTVDETNAVIGAARAIGLPETVDTVLARVQDDSVHVGCRARVRAGQGRQARDGAGFQ